MRDRTAFLFGWLVCACVCVHWLVGGCRRCVHACVCVCACNTFLSPIELKKTLQSYNDVKCLEAENISCKNKLSKDAEFVRYW